MNDSPPHPSEAPRRDRPIPEPPALLPQLWENFRHALSCARAVLRGPGFFAHIGRLVRARRDDALAWLAPLERLARKLITLEALKLGIYPEHLKPPKPAKLKPAAQSADPAHFDPDAPATWRAPFRLFAAKKAAQGRMSSAQTTPPLTYPALPIALRFEALLRVAADPAPYVRRCAMALARQPARVAFLPLPASEPVEPEGPEHMQEQDALARPRRIPIIPLDRRGPAQSTEADADYYLAQLFPNTS